MRPLTERCAGGAAAIAGGGSSRDDDVRGRSMGPSLVAGLSKLNVGGNAAMARLVEI